MKHTLTKTILIILLLASTQIVSAQTNSQTTDLVPYKKGKLWGLVHHDKSPFYPAVFDSIIVGMQDRDMFEVFQYHYNLGPVADVIYKGKRMWLTLKKKMFLLEGNEPDMPIVEAPAKESTDISYEQTVRDEGIIIDESDKSAVIVETIHSGNDTIKIKRENRRFSFFVNDKELTDFRCSFYRRYTDKKGADYYSLIDDETKTTAIASLVQRRLVIPFEYSFLFKCGEADYFIAWKNREAGLVNTEGALLLPVEYRYLINVYNDPDGTVHLSSSKDRKQFSLMAVKDGKVNISPVVYSEIHYYGGGGGKGRYFFALKGEKWGIVNTDDKVMLPFEYDEIYQAQNDFFITKKNGKYGFVDPRVRFLIVKPLYDELVKGMKTNFTIGGSPYYVFMVKKRGQTFYIDQYGTEFIAP